MKQCSTCKGSFPTSEFNWRNKAKQQLQSCCKACHRKSQNKFYRDNPEYQVSIKQKATERKKKIKRTYLEYLRTCHCMDCGISDPVVLTHDHRDPSTKVEIVSVLVHQVSWKRTQEEIAKCDVVCFNCHAKRTAKVQKWYENYGDSDSKPTSK